MITVGWLFLKYWQIIDCLRFFNISLIMFLLILKMLKISWWIQFLFRNTFKFNESASRQIEGINYIDALKSVARKTSDQFYIFYTKLSSKEFCEIVSAGKNCNMLGFYYDLIEFDNEYDFNEEIDGWKITTIYFYSSGGSSYSDWNNKPKRLENLIAAIARCNPLSLSLKSIDFSYCDISSEAVFQIVDKCKFDRDKVKI